MTEQNQEQHHDVEVAPFVYRAVIKHFGNNAEVLYEDTLCGGKGIEHDGSCTVACTLAAQALKLVECNNENSGRPRVFKVQLAGVHECRPNCPDARRCAKDAVRCTFMQVEPASAAELMALHAAAEPERKAA